MFSHMAEAMKISSLDALTKWLLVNICDHANEDGICWPSLNTLARKTCMSKASVARKLNLLEQAGYISRKQTPYASTTYHIVSLRDNPVSQGDTPPVSQGDCKLPSLTNHEAPKSRARLVPLDWVPSEKLKNEINLSQDLNAEGIVNHDFETAKYIDHSHAKGRKLINFDAGYRNWCRNAVKFATASRTGKANGNKQSNPSNNQSVRFREYLNQVS